MTRSRRTVRYICFVLIALLANLGVLRSTKFDFIVQTSLTNPTASVREKASESIEEVHSLGMRFDNAGEPVTNTELNSSVFAVLDNSEASLLLQQGQSIFHNLSERTNIQRTMRFGKHWRPLPDNEFKIPFPVFLASLPKSGTTSIHAYFRCGRARSVHTYCPKNDPSDLGMARLGVVMDQNIQQGLPPFQGCGDNVTDVRGPAKIFTDAGYVLPDGPCYYPSVSSLAALYKSYPNMTIMLSTRESTSWYMSMKEWHGGDLMRRFIEFCDFMPRNNSMEEFVEFYNKHNENIRQFSKQHPSITFVEFAIDSPNVGEYLELVTGIPSSCWGLHLPGRKTSKKELNTGRRRRRKKSHNF